MALRPNKPGEEGMPDTAEGMERYKADLANMNADPAAWANDPILKQARADAAKIAVANAQQVVDDAAKAAAAAEAKAAAETASGKLKKS